MTDQLADLIAKAASSQATVAELIEAMRDPRVTGFHSSSTLGFVADEAGDDEDDHDTKAAANSAAFSAAKAVDAADPYPIQLWPGTYRFDAQLVFDYSFTQLRGIPGNRAVLLAHGDLRDSHAEISTSQRLTDLVFDSGRLAKYGLAFSGAGNSRFERVTSRNAIACGWRSRGGSDNNDWLRLAQCGAYDCGRWYASPGIADEFDSVRIPTRTLTGASVAISGQSLTFTGADIQPDTSELNDANAIPLRVGDLIRVDGDPTVYVTVQSVDSDTACTVSGIGEASGSGLDFCCMVGDGYSQAVGENMIQRFSSFWALYCAGYGMVLDSLYGPAEAVSLRCEFCGAGGIRVGHTGANPVWGVHATGLYFEGLGFDSDRPGLRLMACSGCKFHVDTIANSNKYLASSGTVFAEYYDQELHSGPTLIGVP